ncbi:uncharacterized protein LY89DRAFT_671502 [Mollisia scopiformis]|uniref:Uncharacterized protein n=1 Tax=Mollisia scopiformis TaxID=149040 RepID=A0A194X1Q5_MOLSC|nr:uncharacterized protein LY89DRAFT_671502 [Mollisia scopiformis]KUJ14125.1 hypothetical protein LY89DRAFT_671502 [Mollisia scopiformis]
MVNLAAVDYPFEYERGIVLKGFNTLLVVTAKRVTDSGSAFQWHFVHSKNNIPLSRYTDDERYHIWEEEEESRPQLENIREAIRTFLGWNDCYEIQLGEVDPSDVTVTTLCRMGRSLALKTVGFNAGIGKSPMTVGASATFEVQEDSVRHSRETRFIEMIASSITTPILLYAPDERRGWLVAQLWVLVYMALIYAQQHELEPAPPKAYSNLERTRKLLIENSELKLLPKGVDKEKAELVAYPLKDLLCDLAQGLEWAEEHARRQRKIPLRHDRIYGLEFFELATRQKNYFVKECKIQDTHGGWIKLLDDETIKGVVFCKGLGESFHKVSPTWPL